MSASVLYMSVSVDGYIAGPDDGPDNPGGEGFMRLHEWLAGGESGRPPGPAGQMYDQMVAVARRAGDRPGDRYAGGHPHPLPRPALSRDMP